MSYEPTNWKTGDVVTSAKLNKLENGVAGAGGNLIVHETVTKDGNKTIYTLDKTWKEISDVFMVGCVYVIDAYTSDKETGYVRRIIMGIGNGEDSEGLYYVVKSQPKGAAGALLYYADSENGYPEYTDEE